MKQKQALGNDKPGFGNQKFTAADKKPASKEEIDALAKDLGIQ